MTYSSKEFRSLLESLQKGDEKNFIGKRIRKIIELAIRNKKAAFATQLTSLVVEHDLHVEGLLFLCATALLLDKKPFSAKIALQKELEHFPHCRRSIDLLQEIDAVVGIDIPRHLSSISKTLSHYPASGNLQLVNRHFGERCFILGNAPSLKNHDLRKLHGDVVFSVSNGYLHPDYSIFEPLYHCVPQIPYAETKLAIHDVTHWFQVMDAHLGRATVLLGSAERQLVMNSGVFSSRKTCYVDFNLSVEQRISGSIDLCGPVPHVQSVTVMALFTALYMGFKDIYILGVDHNESVTGKYNYFYEKSCNTGLEGGVDADGNITCTSFEMFKTMYILFNQYENIKKIAAGLGTNIYNLNPYGLLDTFPRINYDTLF